MNFIRKLKSYFLKLTVLILAYIALSSWFLNKTKCDTPEFKIKWDNCINKYDKSIEIKDSNLILHYSFWDVGTPNVLYFKKRNGNFFKIVWDEDGTLLHRSIRNPIDTTPSGSYESFFSNGIIKEKGIYLKNKKINEWKYYNEDGTIYKIEIYDSLGNIIK